MIRPIKTEAITALVERLCIEACCNLTDDIFHCLGECCKTEKSALGKDILHTLIENA